MAQRDLYKFAVGVFQASPGTSYAEYLSNIVYGEGGVILDPAAPANLVAIYQAAPTWPAFTSQDFAYTSASTNQQFATEFVDRLVGNSASAAAKSDAATFLANYIDGQQNAGLSLAAARGNGMKLAIDFLDATAETDATWGAAASRFDNQVDVAIHDTEVLNDGALSIAELQSRLRYASADDASVEASQNANMHAINPGDTFTFESTDALGVQAMRITGDQSARLDFTNPGNQITGLDLDNDGTFDQDGFENANLPAASGFEIVDAYRRAYVVEEDIGSNYLGDIAYDGTGFQGDGVNTDGNVFLGGLGVDEAFGGIGNDFLAGGGVASGRFLPQVGPDGGTFFLDTLLGIPVAFAGGDYIDGGRNADFFFVELSAIDTTDGSSLFFIEGGITADDSIAGITPSSQDSDWLLFEGSDDDEPVTIDFNDRQVDGFGGGSVRLHSGNQAVFFNDLENLDASGNMYGFLDEMNTGADPVRIGGRGIFGPDTNPLDANANDGIGSSAQLWVEGSGADNKLIGGYDNDAIFGRPGNDLLMGGNLRKLINPNLQAIVNDGMDHLAGGQGNDDLVFESDGGNILGGDGTDTLWITEYSMGRNGDGTERAASVLTTDGVVRIDLLAMNIDSAAGYGGADANPTRTTPNSFGDFETWTGTADQTNYNTANASMRVLINEGVENVVATGLGRIDFAAAGTNNPELTFDNIQNFQRYAGDLDLRGTNGANILYASTGNDDIEGRDGNDSMSGGDGLDDFFFGTQDGGSIGGQSSYGDAVDVIHKQRDDTNDNLWDGFNSITASGGNFVQDFGANSQILQGASTLVVDIGSTDLADDDVALTAFNIVIGGVSFSYATPALAAATSVAEAAALIHAAFNAQDSDVSVSAAGTVAGDNQTITVTDAEGRDISDTVQEGYAVTGVVSNGAFEAQATFNPSGTQKVLDRLIYVAYEDRADAEEVDDDAITGSTISLGVDSYAQDRVVGVYPAAGTTPAGTRIAEDQAYTITFTNLTTEDTVTLSLNGVTYKLTVGVDVDGTQVDGEDGLLDSQADIQTAFLARFATFINSFMDDDTQAGSVNATSGATTLTLTQNMYNGEETVFMFTPVVDNALAGAQASGGERWTATISNGSDHDLNLFGFVAADPGNRTDLTRNGALNADDPTTSAAADGNVLFLGHEGLPNTPPGTPPPVVTTVNPAANRSVLATAEDTHTGLDTGVLNGAQAMVINGGFGPAGDDLIGIAHNLATDLELQSDRDDDGDVDDENNGNFAVHGDDLLIGGQGNDTINGLTGDDRVIGSLGLLDVVDGGGDWYFVRRVGDPPNKGNVEYFANSFAASDADDDPDVLDIYLIEQTEDGDNMILGDNFSDYFSDTLQFQQGDFPGTTFTVTLDIYEGLGDDIEFTSGGAGHVTTDLENGGTTVDASTTFRNFEHIRTVSGTGLAVAGAGQGNDTLNVSGLSNDAGEVWYDMTNDPDMTAPFIGDSGFNVGAVIVNGGTGAEQVVITVDGVENVISGPGDDILYIDESEAAKNNSFSAGNGDDLIKYSNNFDPVTTGNPDDIEPTVTINVEVSTNVDTVVMTKGRVGTTVATDTLTSVETISLEQNTAQGIREDDTINVVNVDDATVDYITEEVLEDGVLVLTILNMFEMEYVVADGDDTVIVADVDRMSLNARSDTTSNELIIDTYLNFDFLDGNLGRETIADMRGNNEANNDIPEARNYEQFNFELGQDTDTVDYSLTDGDQIAAVVQRNADTNHVLVSNSADDDYDNAGDRVDALRGVDQVVASTGESILDFTQLAEDVQISFQFDEDNPDENLVRIGDGDGNTIEGIPNFIERFGGANGIAAWTRVEGSDASDAVFYDGSEDLVNQAELDHRYTDDVLTLRGGENNVSYFALETSISAVVSVTEFDVDDPLNTGLIEVDVSFLDGTSTTTILPNSGVHAISSHTGDNGIAAGNLKLEASQDAEDIVGFSSLSDKVFLLGSSPGVIDVLIGDLDAMRLTGFEFLLDPATDDVYDMEDLQTVLGGLVLVDNATDDRDTIKVRDDAVGFQAAPADTISLEVLNDEFAFDFDVLDITEVGENDLLIVGDTNGARDLNDAVRVGSLDLIDNVDFFPTIIFTDASITSAGTTYVVDIDNGELRDGGNNLLFTFDATLLRFDFREISPATGVTVTTIDTGGMGVTILTDGVDSITGDTGDDVLVSGGNGDTVAGGGSEVLNEFSKEIDVAFGGAVGGFSIDIDGTPVYTTTAADGPDAIGQGIVDYFAANPGATWSGEVPADVSYSTGRVFVSFVDPLDVVLDDGTTVDAAFVSNDANVAGLTSTLVSAYAAPGAGNDTIRGGTGADDLDGGAGDDTFVVVGSVDADMADDYINNAAVDTQAEIDAIVGSADVMLLSELQEVHTETDEEDGDGIDGGTGADEIIAFGTVSFVDTSPFTDVETLVPYSHITLTLAQLNSLAAIRFNGDGPHTLGITDNDGNPLTYAEQDAALSVSPVALFNDGDAGAQFSLVGEGFSTTFGSLPAEWKAGIVSGPVTQAVFEAYTVGQVDLSPGVAFDIEPEDMASILQDVALQMGVEAWTSTDATDVITVADPLVNTYAEVVALNGLAFVDKIDNTGANLMVTYAELTSGNLNKLTAGGTLTVSDTGANIVANLAAILAFAGTQGATVDALNANDNMVTLTAADFAAIAADADGALLATNDAIAVANEGGQQTYNLDSAGGGVATVVIAAGSSAANTLADADTISNFATGFDNIDAPIGNGITIADGTGLADFSAFLAAADTAIDVDDVYVAWNAAGSGNAWVYVDQNANGILDGGTDSVAILVGINAPAEIAAGDFI